LALADTHRDTLSAIFSPVSGRMVQLKVTRDDGAVRQIDCYTAGMLDMPGELGRRVLGLQRVGVQLKAPNPVWYDPTQQAIAFNAVTLPWYTGEGLLGTAFVATFAGTPAAGSTTTTGAIDPAYWSIYVRASADTPPSGAGERGLFYAGTGGTASGTASWYTASTANVYGTFNAKGFAGSASQTFDFGTGTVDMWFVRTGGYSLSLYSGTAYIGNFNYIGPGAFSPDISGSVVWGSVPGGNAWTGTITHAAVYKTPVSAAVRAAVQQAAAVPITRYNGTANVAGSWDDYPVITIVGPINNPVITNLTTGEALDFTGATISAGDYYQIDTRYGYKTITNNAGSSVINKLTDASDLASFHLPPGNNAIQVSFTGGTTSASTVSMSYFNRYLGL
jgi:hypothetical protein